MHLTWGAMLAARPPEAIFLFSTPVLSNVARFVSGRFDLFRRMYWWQVGRGFIRDEEVREEFVPLLYEQFAATRRAPSRRSSRSTPTCGGPSGPARVRSPRCELSGIR